jgi:hypothetical protein
MVNRIVCLFVVGSGSHASNSDRIGFFNPVMAFMGNNGEEDSAEASEKQQPPKSTTAEQSQSASTEAPTSKVDASEESESTQSPKPSEQGETLISSTEPPVSKAEVSEQLATPKTPKSLSATEEKPSHSTESPTYKGDSEAPQSPTDPSTAEENSGSTETGNTIETGNQDHQETKYSGPNDEAPQSQIGESDRGIPDGTKPSSPTELDQSGNTGTTEYLHAGTENIDDKNAIQSQPLDSILASSDDVNEAVKIVKGADDRNEISSSHENTDTVDQASHVEVIEHDEHTNAAENDEEANRTEAQVATVVEREENTMVQLEDLSSMSIIVSNDSNSQNESVPTSADVPVGLVEVGSNSNDLRKEENIQGSVTTSNHLESVGAVAELEKLRREMKMMEAALQGAARQSQSKADEIARLMNENEQLKSTIDDLKSKSAEAEMDALKDEYHQRVATLERKVYALTKERDTLRREQNKKSDAAALLKEKDEIISQVMAEGIMNQHFLCLFYYDCV